MVSPIGATVFSFMTNSVECDALPSTPASLPSRILLADSPWPRPDGQISSDPPGRLHVARGGAQSQGESVAWDRKLARFQRGQYPGDARHRESQGWHVERDRYQRVGEGHVKKIVLDRVAVDVGATGRDRHLRIDVNGIKQGNDLVRKDA